MSLYYAYCTDKDLKEMNGATIVLLHHLHALEQVGHQSGGLLTAGVDEIPPEAEYILFQSEWWNVIKPHLETSRAKRVCWLGHFSPSVSKYGMPKIEDIKAHFFYTQWKGECVEWAKEKIGKDIFYMPHGACELCNTEGKIIPDYYKAIFIGNNYPERNQDWLENITMVQTPFIKAKDSYKSALVSPNLHGDFQKGIPTDFFQVPGHMINDRIFNVIMSGGFTISDNNPIVKDFFTEDEVPYAETKEQYQEMIRYFIAHPEERLPYMKKAKKKIMENYTYKKYWEQFSKII